MVMLHGRGPLEVHDLLRDLDQEIGRRAKSHHVCDTMDDGKAIANQGGIETMALNLRGNRKQKLDVESFTNMPNLGLLKLPHGCIMDGDLKCISKQLQWLQWRNVPFQSVPMELNLVHLVSLDFFDSTNSSCLWMEANGGVEGYPNLRFLNLSGCTSITKLPDSIGRLSQLQDLRLDCCRQLKKLPESFGQLKALKSLIIDFCTTLKAFPNSLGLSSLRHILAQNCKSLMKLPTSIGQSSLLESLNLSGCESLKKLPKSIGLHALKSLGLSYCISLKSLPDSIGALLNLEDLHAFGCNSSVKLPSSIGLCPSLRYLQIGASPKCQVFSDGNVGAAWTQLLALTLSNYGGLRSLFDFGVLKSLEYLELCDNTLTELPESLGLLVRLKTLKMCDCERLQMECLPKSFADHNTLDSLCLQNCKNLRRLPKNLAELTSLKWLFIHCCPIRRIPKSISQLSQLRSLHIDESKNLQKLPTSIRQLKRLREFELIGCGSIEAIGALTTLQGLPIWGSTSLTRLPASLAMVSRLVIYGDNDDYLLHLCDGSSYDVLEDDETGFLRAYRNKSTGRTTLVRRSHKRTMIDELLGNSGKA